MISSVRMLDMINREKKKNKAMYLPGHIKEFFSRFFKNDQIGQIPEGSENALMITTKANIQVSPVTKLLYNINFV